MDTRAATDKVECFVVMPYGVKPARDGSVRTYDFEKVYRVIIKRAVQNAGMRPVRSDERIGPAIIHSEMFKDLRDRRVVLADLSLENPNVFYELGARHVMSRSGTVLMCRKGSELPFDVKLSRVVFYDYDGVSLDYEEVERVVSQLEAALHEADQGNPDSPVHAFLESVLRPSELSFASGVGTLFQTAVERDHLECYEALIAQSWLEKPIPLAELRSHRTSVFGARCLGRYCLSHPGSLPEGAEDEAAHLSDAEQYRLANRIFERLQAEGRLTTKGRLRYANSLSEANPEVGGADRAIDLAVEATAAVEAEWGTRRDTPEASAQFAECYRRLAALQYWRSTLTRRTEDLALAVESFTATVQFCDRARAAGLFPHPGVIAQARLKLMLILRIRDGNPDRSDTEGHRDAIVRILPRDNDTNKGLSYLNWFQAIALADAGAADLARQKALTALSYDARLMSEPDKYWEIGRRQYRNLRRFLEQHSQVLRNRTSIGTIAQYLQTEPSA